MTIDCRDPRTVAEFWAEALGWGGVSVSPDGTGASCGPPTGGTSLEFVTVPEPKTIKNRVHLGCTVGRLEDLDAEIARLEGLGATVAWEEDFGDADYRNVILRDVEGNEFCLGAGTFPG